MLPAGFERAIQASEPAQIHSLGRVATGIGSFLTINSDYYPNSSRLLFNMNIHGVLCELGRNLHIVQQNTSFLTFIGAFNSSGHSSSNDGMISA
jgi:hypothetical protein